MIKNELMIGDWVFVTHTEDGIAPYDEEVKLTKDDFGFSEVFFEAHVHPIPLTQKILEKNGFVNKKGRFMQKGNFDNPPLIMWRLVDDEILKKPKSQLEIHYGAKSMHVLLVCIYVHELQHALRFCRIKMEISL